jgi:hypothetical protein
MRNTTSVLMAEAAAMTLAAKAPLLQLQGINFLTDNQHLVTFDSANHSTPPDWTIKWLTQQFINYTSQSSCHVYKISRDSNITAHMLASHASSDNTSSSQDVVVSCSRLEHVTMCPLGVALSSVQWEYFSLLAA